MPKFSIIIPAYNVEKYLKTCLDSVFSQTFKDFEAIVINDGSDDNSMEIAKKYDVLIINQKNQGLSAARNCGIKKATGEYILFLDSDDYIEKELLEKINSSLSNSPDIVRYQAKEIINNNIVEYKEKAFSDYNGQTAFNSITEFHYVEPAWLYAIKRSYFQTNQFKFMDKMYHEDFGLIPLIVLKSRIVNCIDYCGYCYVKRENSIMNDSSYKKQIKKVEDSINQYKFLIKEAKQLKIDTSCFKSFISNSVIKKICSLNGKDYKKYKKVIKEERIIDNLMDDSLGRKIKKGIVKISPKLYYNVLRKK